VERPETTLAIISRDLGSEFKDEDEEEEEDNDDIILNPSSVLLAFLLSVTRDSTTANTIEKVHVELTNRPDRIDSDSIEEEEEDENERVDEELSALLSPPIQAFDRIRDLAGLSRACSTIIGI
jgi:hypothetical protein